MSPNLERTVRATGQRSSINTRLQETGCLCRHNIITPHTPSTQCPTVAMQIEVSGRENMV